MKYFKKSFERHQALQAFDGLSDWEQLPSSQGLIVFFLVFHVLLLVFLAFYSDDLLKTLGDFQELSTDPLLLLCLSVVAFSGSFFGILSLVLLKINGPHVPNNNALKTVQKLFFFFSVAILFFLLQDLDEPEASFFPLLCVAACSFSLSVFLFVHTVAYRGSKND